MQVKNGRRLLSNLSIFKWFYLIITKYLPAFTAPAKSQFLILNVQ